MLCKANKHMRYMEIKGYYIPTYIPQFKKKQKLCECAKVIYLTQRAYGIYKQTRTTNGI